MKENVSVQLARAVSGLMELKLCLEKLVRSGKGNSKTL